ncbi:BrnA antitoxin family protein (plasmid) [Roseivivax marinus]|uniref:CopG family antitoxin n=1 Tax=Roseivivax marinus TaxID=1379903 RepID=UPI001F046A06|nr:CopG family antitoxin [Roseivivax marinus]UMA67302.1 BrnA antitoxin family protein [Roseivivax marinus]
MSGSKKQWPTLPTDEAAEQFVDEADLSAFDWSQAVPVSYEMRTKEKQLNLRMSEAQLAALKAAAQQQGVPYTRLARMMIERALLTFKP